MQTVKWLGRSLGVAPLIIGAMAYVGVSSAGATTPSAMAAVLFFQSPTLSATANCTEQPYPGASTSTIGIQCSTMNSDFLSVTAIISGPTSGITFPAGNMEISSAITFDVEGCGISLTTGVTLTGVGGQYETLTPYSTEGRITVTEATGGTATVCEFIQTALETTRASFTADFWFGT